MAETKDSAEVAVAFDAVSVAFGGAVILDGVTAHVPRGSCTAVVGPNGAGKTTLLLALLGEIPYAGRIQFNGKSGGQHLRIGYVPQRLQFDLGMPLTVLEFMVMGWQRSPLCFGIHRHFRVRAETLLACVQAEGLASRRVGALSGGELQRVLLALALGRDPELLVLDEPASGVDFQGERLFCELLARLRRERGFTQLMVSHDLSTVTHHATHAICLNRRIVAEGVPREVLTVGTLTRLFGLHMGLPDTSVLPPDVNKAATCCCEKGGYHGGS